MKTYDISRTISPQSALFPGDPPMTIEILMSLSKGDPVNLTRIALSPHTATHADAGWHFAEEGLYPDQLPLEHFMGVAQVVTVSRREGGITQEEVQKGIHLPIKRLLIHTWCSELPDTTFPDNPPYPSLELIDWLADLGVLLLGMDTPSVDDVNSQDLPGHHRLRDRNMVHLENLCLAGVPDGRYELIALPLKIANVCGSPVRAVLRG
jgi:arylformamidase